MEPQADRRVKRTPLSRERVLAAALIVADKGGIEFLSIRHIADELGAKPMALYNHISSKDDILDGIVDLVFNEITVPSDSADWMTAMRLRAHSARDALVRHPWASVLMQSRTNPGPATLRHQNDVIGCLRTGGFTIHQAAHAFSVIDSYIYGFTQQQRNLTYTTPEQATAVAGNILHQLPADKYPHLAAMIIEHALQPDYDYAAEFDFGLNLILDGLEALVERSEE
jgi:AcrR family transcriptional regulator